MFGVGRFAAPWARCVAISLVLWVAVYAAWGSSARRSKAPADLPAVSNAPGTPARSAFFISGREEPYSTYQMPGDGDLWPSCWAKDDNLYTANGDGAAFTGSSLRPDMQVSRIAGMPPHLAGTVLASDVGTNWSGRGFNRKPTGMLCVHGVLYLAFQNLDSVAFNSAPAGSVARSVDYGRTWQWDKTQPMFGGTGQPPLFTTVFFLDFGKNSADAIDHYVYAYGLDNNWRSQQALFLGRVPANKVMNRSAWQFYAGQNGRGEPIWVREITRKQPVLLDTRQVRPEGLSSRCPVSDSVIAQGGVVYDKPLKRYLFTSWSCSTHEFYEAAKPWGPWRHILSHDFEGPWTVRNRGQYGTSVPSKFISADGKHFFLQSNVCCSGDSYTFSLREVELNVAPEKESRGWSWLSIPARLTTPTRGQPTH